MGRGFVFVALGLCLSGCTTNKVDDRLGKLVGKNVQEAVSLFGPADGQPVISGNDKSYVWTTNQDVGAKIQSSQLNGALVGMSQGSETVTTKDIVHLDCKMQFTTDQADQIKTYQWSGDRFCAKYYADLLKPPSNYSCDKMTNVRVHSVCY